MDTQEAVQEPPAVHPPVDRTALLSMLRTTSLVRVHEHRRHGELSAAWSRLADLIEGACLDAQVTPRTVARLPDDPDFAARLRAVWNTVARDVDRELLHVAGGAERTRSRVLQRIAEKEHRLWSARIDAVDAQLDLIEALATNAPGVSHG